MLSPRQEEQSRAACAMLMQESREVGVIHFLGNLTTVFPGGPGSVGGSSLRSTHALEHFLCASRYTFEILCLLVLIVTKRNRFLNMSSLNSLPDICL